MKKTKELKKETVEVVKKEKQVDPTSLDGIPGLGDVSKNAIVNDGCFNGLELVYRGPTYLKELTGMDRQKASDAIKYLRNRLETAGLLRPVHQTATQVQQLEIVQPKLSTGAKGMDRILGGGLSINSVTEFYGHNGSGKTQTSHTVCIQAFKDLKDGGLNKHELKPYCVSCNVFRSEFVQEDNCPTCKEPLTKIERPMKVLFIDTERTTSPERLTSILAGKGMIVAVPEKYAKKIREGGFLTIDDKKEVAEIEKLQAKEAQPYLDNVMIWYALNGINQEEMTAELFHVVPEENIKLIIVDSGTALYRGEFIGRGNMKSKFDVMNVMLGNLKKVSELYSVPVVFVNQIYNKPDEMFGNDPDIPYGGNIIGHMIPTRVKLWKAGRKHKARIIKSNHLDNLDCEFDIDASGIIDIA